MNRRQFIATSALAAAATQLPGRLSAQPNDINILMIIADDLNDWLGCLGGHPQAHTPNLDALAGMGTNFTNAYCSAPSCSPSRATLLTGIYPHTSGVYGNEHVWYDLIPDAITIPHHFGDHGYYTMACAKIEHDNETGVWNQRAPHTSTPHAPRLQRNRLRRTNNNTWDWGELDLKVEDTNDYIHGNWTIQRLLNPPTTPFLMAHGNFRPHVPWYVPRQFYERYHPSEVELPPYLSSDRDDIPPAGLDMIETSITNRTLSARGWHDGVAAYLASVEYTDAMLGRVLDAWQDSPVRDETIVIVTSDHGFMLGEKYHWGKFCLWEGATRIPMIIHVPWLSSPGDVCTKPIQNGDLFPTLCELTGLPMLADQFEGETLVPQLINPDTDRNRPVLTTYYPGNHTIRNERWRYIRYADGSDELYDHLNDPNEWTNLAGNPQYQWVIDELSPWIPNDG